MKSQYSMHGSMFAKICGKVLSKSVLDSTYFLYEVDVPRPQSDTNDILHVIASTSLDIGTMYLIAGKLAIRFVNGVKQFVLRANLMNKAENPNKKINIVRIYGVIASIPKLSTTADGSTIASAKITYDAMHYERTITVTIPVYPSEFAKLPLGEAIYISARWINSPMLVKGNIVTTSKLLVKYYHAYNEDVSLGMPDWLKWTDKIPSAGLKK